jgi:hypothetical protein
MWVFARKYTAFLPVIWRLRGKKSQRKTANGTDVARVAQQRRDSNKAERIKRDFYRALWENAFIHTNRVTKER